MLESGSWGHSVLQTPALVGTCIGTLYFGDLHPVFKIRLGLRLLVNGLSAPCLLKEWIDFDLTCTSKLL